MKRINKQMALTITALMILCLGFTSCNKNKWIETDYSNDIVGTWTCLEAGVAEALVFGADGTIVSTGVENDIYWENLKGTYEMVNNKMTLKFDDGDSFEGRFEIIPGETLALIGENDERHTYRYCKEDLSEEVVGMWICNDGLLGEDGDMTIQTFNEDGKAYFTGGLITDENEHFLNIETTYKVIGDLLFQKMPENPTENAFDLYKVIRLIYAPNATSLGDIMTQVMYLLTENGLEENVTSWLRVKESLDLSGKKYDYSDLYVSNVSGLDMDIEFMGYIMNFANMDGSKLDMMLKSILFNIEFPDANTISYSYYFNNNVETYNAPIEIEGNKMTIKMSNNVPTFKDVVFYAFQDIDACQMHIYMHRDSFVNFYTNMQATLMTMEDEQFDITDEAAINAIYNSISDAVTSINLSLIFKN